MSAKKKAAATKKATKSKSVKAVPPKSDKVTKKPVSAAKATAGSALVTPVASFVVGDMPKGCKATVLHAGIAGGYFVCGFTISIENKIAWSMTALPNDSRGRFKSDDLAAAAGYQALLDTVYKRLAEHPALQDACKLAISTAHYRIFASRIQPRVGSSDHESLSDANAEKAPAGKKPAVKPKPAPAPVALDEEPDPEVDPELDPADELPEEEAPEEEAPEEEAPEEELPEEELPEDEAPAASSKKKTPAAKVEQPVSQSQMDRLLSEDNFDI